MTTRPSPTPTPTRIEALYGDRLVPCYTERPANLNDMLQRAVAARGDDPAVEDGDRSLSYRALDAHAARIAAALAANGIARGDRVALFLGNRLEFITCLFGIWRLGAIVVPIGTRQSANELRYMLNQCGASALVFDAALANRIPPATDIATVRVAVHVDESGAPAFDGGRRSIAFSDWLRDDAQSAPAEPLSDQEPACLMYTSGTTGHPKGAVLSHLGFFHTAHHYRHRFGYRADDRTLLVIPASHISGLLAVIVVMVEVGGCVVLLRQFAAADTLAQIEARRVTAAVMVPAMYNLLLLQPELRQRDLSRWRIGHFGGAAMPEVTIQRLSDALPALALYNGFGATETTSAVSLTTAEDTGTHADTVGTLLPCIDIRVLDADGVEVAPGESGELWIRSPGNAIGYWDNPAATRAIFVAGYWRSGDVGSVDAHGYLRVFDRIKDMINRGGYKVYCVELENLIQRFTGVVEAAAVASPCPVLGERIHVFVYANAPIDADALRAFCRAALADYKTPDFITQTPTPLPRNLNGKLVKAPLRELARQAVASTASQG